MDSTNLIPFSAIEIDVASKLAQAIDPESIQTIAQFDKCIQNETISKELLPHFLDTRRFDNCLFNVVSFLGQQANDTVFKDCKLQKCRFEKSNFRSSSFSGSELSLTGFANSFDFSDFSNASLHQVDFTGCSFSDAYFYKANISNSRFAYSEFVATTFSKTRLEQVDFSRSNLDFSEFDDVTISHVTFPYWGTLHVVKGLRDIIDGREICFSTPDGSHCVDSEKYLEEMRLMRAFLYQKKDFFALANLYIFDGETAKAYEAIMEGIKYACMQGLLKPLRFLCRMASINGFFTTKQLRNFYKEIENAIYNRSLTPIQYKNYAQELDMARRCLIDYPYSQDTISIAIQTSIPYTDYPKLSETIKMLNGLIAETAPLAISHIEIRHNSPVELLIQAAGEWGNLLLIVIAIWMTVDKSTALIERIQNIILNRKKMVESEHVAAEMAQLKKKIDEMATSYQKPEDTESEKSTVSLLRPGMEDFERISYLLISKKEFPDELRALNLSK